MSDSLPSKIYWQCYKNIFDKLLRVEFSSYSYRKYLHQLLIYQSHLFILKFSFYDNMKYARAINLNHLKLKVPHKMTTIVRIEVSTYLIMHYKSLNCGKMKEQKTSSVCIIQQFMRYLRKLTLKRDNQEIVKHHLLLLKYTIKLLRLSSNS